MDHAEAHERIADLALEPRRLLDLELDPTPEDRALQAHADGCAACRADLDAWRRTHEAVFLATVRHTDIQHEVLLAAAERPVEPPASLRADVSAIPRRTPRPFSLNADRSGTPIAAHDRRRSGRRWTALAAVLIVGLVVGLGAVAVDQVRQADAARQRVAELADLSGSLDRVLREAGHASVALVGIDGTAAGTATWSSGEIVVMTTALTPPGPGAEYRCWVERDGQRTPIGIMRFADGIAYWAGPLDRYDGLDLGPGGRLGVSLESSGEPGGHAPVLIGELPS